MNQQQYDQIKLAAFENELQKIAGPVTEVIGSAASFPESLITGGIGYMAGPRTSKEDIKKAEKRTWSNLLLPFAAPYRLGRRIATNQSNPKLMREALLSLEKEKSKKK